MLGDGNQLASHRCAPRGYGEAFKALVVREGLEIRRHIDCSAARLQSIAAVVEAHNLLDPFKSDVKCAVVFGERFSIEPAARRERLAVSAEDRRKLGIDYAGWPVVAVNNAGAEPGAPIGCGNETAAVRFDKERRNPAEGRIV